MNVKKIKSYKIGDKVLIVQLDKLLECESLNPSGKMNKYAGTEMTVAIISIDKNDNFKLYKMEEDKLSWFWYPEMIQGKIYEY